MNYREGKEKKTNLNILLGERDQRKALLGSLRTICQWTNINIYIFFFFFSDKNKYLHLFIKKKKRTNINISFHIYDVRLREKIMEILIGPLHSLSKRYHFSFLVHNEDITKRMWLNIRKNIYIYWKNTHIYRPISVSTVYNRYETKSIKLGQRNDSLCSIQLCGFPATKTRGKWCMV